jgi:hypothetical protein
MSSGIKSPMFSHQMFSNSAEAFDLFSAVALATTPLGSFGLTLGQNAANPGIAFAGK